MNVEIAKILKQRGWKNAKTFFNFYKKDIVYDALDDVARLHEYFKMKYLCQYVVYFTFMLEKQSVSIYIQRI